MDTTLFLRITSLVLSPDKPVLAIIFLLNSLLHCQRNTALFPDCHSITQSPFTLFYSIGNLCVTDRFIWCCRLQLLIFYCVFFHKNQLVYLQYLLSSKLIFSKINGKATLSYSEIEKNVFT